MERLNSSSPHFIRCIKPNITKQPDSFATDYVARQLRYVGVMETTRIRQCGYPVRLTYEEFLTRFDVLRDFYTYEPNKPPLTDYQAVNVVLEKVRVTGWVNGLHKVFLKFQHPLQLDQHSQHILLHIIAIQRWFRELKEWKAAQEGLRIKKEKAKSASSSNQVLKTSDMTHYRRNVNSVQDKVRNSNHNNSRSTTKPQGFVMPTANDYINDGNESTDDDIYDTVIEQDFSSIKSLPLSDDIMLTSASPHENDIEIIYDSADGVLQAESRDYYNYNEDDIYDDISFQPYQPSPTARIIEEDIYDDTTSANAFHSNTSVVCNPPRHPQSLPSFMDEEEAVYSDATSVFQAPPQNSVPPFAPEENEGLYTDVSSVFNEPPSKQSISQVKPCATKVSQEYPSETYTCLIRKTEGMSILASEETKSGPPIPVRSPNLMKIGKASSQPNIAPEGSPSHLRRSSEQLSVVPISKPPFSPPRNKKGIPRKRSKAIKSRSDSESSNTSFHQSLSPGGSVVGSNNRISSYSEVFSSPPLPAQREERHHSESTEKFFLPTIPAGVTVNNFKDEPVDEDYAEIEDCHELHYPISSLPQEYLTPVKQKPHRKLKQSKSADIVQRNPINQSIDVRPPAPLPAKTLMNNPPPKPPRTRSKFKITGSPNKRSQPSPPLRYQKAVLPDAPTVPPPPIPGRHTPCVDPPTTTPPPRPVRKTPMSFQSSKNALPVTQAPKPPINKRSKQEATDSTGSQMTQKKANLGRTIEEIHSIPVPPQVPRHKRPKPPLPSKQGIPYSAVTLQEPNTNSDVPDWKKNVIEKKRRELEPSQNGVSNTETQWGAVPAWKRKLLQERVDKKQ